MADQPRDGWKILVVDDDWEDYLIIREIMREKQGDSCEVTYVDHVNQLRDLLFHRRPPADVVLMDYYLEWASGLELIWLVKQFCPGTSCIMVTDWPQPEVEAHAMEHGADGFLRKSDLTGEILCGKIQEVLDSRRRPAG